MLTALPATAIAALLLLAAWRDIATRLIPDGISLAIALLGVALRLPEGLSALLQSALVAALLFALLLALAMRGLLGGGDVKLAAAMALALPPAATWDFIVATTMAGGLLGALFLCRPRLAPRPLGGPAASLPARILAVEARRLRRGGPLPYAVAIALGGILILATIHGG